MITNPILPGFNPDPCIVRKNEDYYIAVSSFEWLPGIPVYHSTDLQNWELYTHVLDDNYIDLKRLPSAKGIWAPCLTYCEEEDLFYIIYGVMNSMEARYFDVDNYLISAKDIRGPWSEPVYLHSAGFDASILHDDDGRKYIVSLEWETRDGYEKPGVICLSEYDPKEKKIIGYPKRIWGGGTDRGCIEAPHLTKKNGRYYLMCAEGGTGYNHCVTMARADNVWGPYEGDPENPIITSQPVSENERHDPDHLKPKYFNPDSGLQKSGHASFIETPSGEVYATHLCARPFITDDADLTSRYRCTLGRETSMQKMYWTEDGWLRMADGSNIAKTEIFPVDDSENEEAKGDAAGIPEKEKAFDAIFRPVNRVKGLSVSERDDFDGDELGICYYSPRLMPESFSDVTSRKGYLRIRGQEAPTSLNKVSLVARKLTSVKAVIETKMEFTPEVYQHSAGLIMYYDNMNFIYLRKYYSQTLGQSAIALLQLENGNRTEYLDTRIAVGDEPVKMKVTIDERAFHFSYALGEAGFNQIGKSFDTSILSDEYCKYGEFTGAFVGVICVDRMFHSKCADFDYFDYEVE